MPWRERSSTVSESAARAMRRGERRQTSAAEPEQHIAPRISVAKAIAITPS